MPRVDPGFPAAATCTTVEQVATPARLSKLRQTPPRVTLLIPAYQAGAFAHQAVACALGQTYPEIEVIVSPDDGDAYRHLRERFESPRLRILAPGAFERSGAGAARNRAIDASTGDFFTMLDADDLIPLDYVERLMRIALVDGAAVAPLHYVDWHARHTLRVPPLPGDRITLDDFARTLGSMHPLIHRSLECGYRAGFAEDVLHDGEIVARLGAVRVVAEAPYRARVRYGSECHRSPGTEQRIHATYSQYAQDIEHHPTRLGLHSLSRAGRASFAALFRFRAMVSAAFARSAAPEYNAWVAGHEAMLHEQFEADFGFDDDACAAAALPARASALERHTPFASRAMTTNRPTAFSGAAGASMGC